MNDAVSVDEAVRIVGAGATNLISEADLRKKLARGTPLRVKLVAERGSGRLLGLQAVGKGVDKRIDVVATALHAGLTVADMAWLDLGYAPPFNSVWDPLHVAASVLQKEV